MKFWSRGRIFALIGLIVAGLSVTGWQTFSSSAVNNPDSKQNRATSKMTYGRFLEYLDMGWIKTVDFYDNTYQEPDYEEKDQQDIDLEADDEISQGKMESLEAGIQDGSEGLSEGTTSSIQD